VAARRCAKTPHRNPSDAPLDFAGIFAFDFFYQKNSAYSITRGVAEQRGQ
jgi:hypothetical protein